MDVRRGGSEFVLTTNLIVHHSITNIFDQTAKFIRILDVVEETLRDPLLCQWLELLEDIFQFPNDPCQARFMTLESVGVPFKSLPPFSLVGIINRCAERFSERLDPGCQRFYRFLVRSRTLGHL